MVILHTSYVLVVGELEGIEHRPGEFCIPGGNPAVEHMKILLRARLVVYDPCRWRRESIRRDAGGGSRRHPAEA